MNNAIALHCRGQTQRHFNTVYNETMTHAHYSCCIAIIIMKTVLIMLLTFSQTIITNSDSGCFVCIWSSYVLLHYHYFNPYWKLKNSVHYRSRDSALKFMRNHFWNMSTPQEKFGIPSWLAILSNNCKLSLSTSLHGIAVLWVNMSQFTQGLVHSWNIIQNV